MLGTRKYLGLLSMIGRDMITTMNFIKDQVWQQSNSYNNKCLSKAGQEVMIKFVLHAIPSYVMSIFLLHTSLVNIIEKMMNSLWCGHVVSNN